MARPQQQRRLGATRANALPEATVNVTGMESSAFLRARQLLALIQGHSLGLIAVFTAQGKKCSIRLARGNNIQRDAHARGR